MYHLKRQEVIALRLKGESYGKIAKILGVSKSSVSVWCRDLKLPQAIQKIIDDRIQHSRIYLVAYNQKRHESVQAENKKIRKEASQQISSLSKKELLLVGTALFWGEGYKKAENLRSPHLCFVNSDSDMIILFMRFIREVMKVSDDRIRSLIHVYPSINNKKAINFWAKITGLPKDNFCITEHISRASQGRRPYNSLPNGTLDLRINSRQEFFRIRGWLDGLIKQKKK